MNIDEFYQTLDQIFAANEIDKADVFLTASLDQAREESDYASYLAIGNEMIGYYRSVSDFRRAFDVAEDVLLLLEELKLEDSEHFATTLLNTATCYRAAGQQKQAYQYYLRALKLYEGILPPGDYRFAGLYNNMSLLLEQMDENEHAVTLLEHALAILKELKDTSSEQASTMTNLALLYFKLDENEKAAGLLTEALLIFEAAGESADAHYSAALAGAGEAYFRMKKYDEALASYEKAAAEVKKHFGENQSYGLLCENCAAVCVSMGAEEKAAAFREKAAKVYQRLQE